MELKIGLNYSWILFIFHMDHKCQEFLLISWSCCKIIQFDRLVSMTNIMKLLPRVFLLLAHHLLPTSGLRVVDNGLGRHEFGAEEVMVDFAHLLDRKAALPSQVQAFSQNPEKPNLLLSSQSAPLQLRMLF